MTNPIVTWQEKQKENNLSDEQLSYKVKRKIDKWQKLTNTLPDIEQAIVDTNAEVEKHADKPNGHPYKRAKKQAEELEALLSDTQTEVAELNSILCNDMDRLVRDAEKNKLLAERLRQANSKKGSDAGTTGPPAANAGTPEAITESMKTDLYCLNYTKEDIDGMEVATALEIIQKKKGKPTAAGTASVPVMITNAMIQKLQELGYSKEDIDAMAPENANEILNAGAAKPGAGTGTEEPGPAPTQHSAGGNTVTGNNNAQPAPVVKIKPVRTEPAAPDKQKKMQNAVLIGVGTDLRFIAGIFIGRRLK